MRTQNVSAYTSDQQGVTGDSVVSVDVTSDEKVVTLLRILLLMKL